MVYIELPNFEARYKFIQKKLNGLTDLLTHDDFSIVAQRTENYSGSDLDALCSEVANQPLLLAIKTNKFKVVYINNQQKFMPLPVDSP